MTLLHLPIENVTVLVKRLVPVLHDLRFREAADRRRKRRQAPAVVHHWRSRPYGAQLFNLNRRFMLETASPGIVETVPSPMTPWQGRAGQRLFTVSSPEGN